MKRLLALVVCFLLLTDNAFAQTSTLLLAGQWRGVLTLNDTTELPFTFEITHGDGGSFLTVINAQERILVDAFRFTSDSVWWTMPVFNTKFRCKRESDVAFSGEWNNTAASKPYVLKFKAVYNRPRITPLAAPCTGRHNFSGKYECTFSPGEKDSSKAVGLFSLEKDGRYTGTFLTETGDYRYLEGAEIACDEVALSCFDGQHAFLFTFKWSPRGAIDGKFWSGKYWYEAWEGKSNPGFGLRNPESLTWITDSSHVNFTFNDLHGKPVSLSDYRGKVVLVQIMGSWCPNCMDETQWLAPVYDKYKAQGFEVIALAYERKGDTATQNAAIRRVKNRFNANYTFLNTGKSGKDSAAASLPFLNGIMSFPTTIYIDRSGNVRKTYTGFNGPATGAYYTKDTEEALRFIQQLLAEKPKK